MRLALMYHDVVENGNFAASGFPGPGADRYKLDRLEFARHLRAIKEAVGNQPVLLTFDDGGISAHERIAGMLEESGWRGHFFVTTDWIGRPGFLNALQIQELDRRGHTVGSHSVTHPVRMSQIPWDRMVSEWRDSRAQLEKITWHHFADGNFHQRAIAPHTRARRDHTAQSVSCLFRPINLHEVQADAQHDHKCNQRRLEHLAQA